MSAFGNGSLPDPTPTDPHWRYHGPRVDYERDPAKADAERRAMTLEQTNALRKKMGLRPLTE